MGSQVGRSEAFQEHLAIFRWERRPMDKPAARSASIKSPTPPATTRREPSFSARWKSVRTRPTARSLFESLNDSCKTVVETTRRHRSWITFAMRARASPSGSSASREKTVLSIEMCNRLVQVVMVAAPNVGKRASVSPCRWRHDLAARGGSGVNGFAHAAA